MRTEEPEGSASGSHETSDGPLHEKEVVVSRKLCSRLDPRNRAALLAPVPCDQPHVLLAELRHRDPVSAAALEAGVRPARWMRDPGLVQPTGGACRKAALDAAFV